MNKQAILKQVNAHLKGRGIKDSPIPGVLEIALNDLAAGIAAVDEYGMMIKDERGSLKINPCQGVKERAVTSIRGCIKDCGLNPASLGIREKPATDEDDPLESMARL